MREAVKVTHRDREDIKRVRASALNNSLSLRATARETREQSGVRGCTSKKFHYDFSPKTGHKSQSLYQSHWMQHQSHRSLTAYTAPLLDPRSICSLPLLLSLPPSLTRCLTASACPFRSDNRSAEWRAQPLLAPGAATAASSSKRVAEEPLLLPLYRSTLASAGKKNRKKSMSLSVPVLSPRSRSSCLPPLFPLRTMLPSCTRFRSGSACIPSCKMHCLIGAWCMRQKKHALQAHEQQQLALLHQRQRTRRA